MNEETIIEIKDEKLHELPLKKYTSLPERTSSDDDPSQHDSSNILSHKICLTNLLKMGFDINICFKILETSPINETSPEIFLQIIMEKYYIQNKEGIKQNKMQENPKQIESLVPLDLNFFFDVSRSIKNKIQSKKKAKTVVDPIPPDFYIEIQNESQPNIVPIKEEPINVLIPEPEIVFNGPTKICPICYETKEETSFLSLSNCDDSFCEKCLSDYLIQLINSAKLVKIPCPSNCGADLSDSDIEIIFKNDPNLIIKLKKVRTALLINMDPLNRWCINPDCNTIIRNTSMQKKIQCNNCGLEMCFDCRGAWHGKITCEQALDKEIKKYSKDKNVKLCPKCKTRIEKNEGCNHMTCSRCRHQFCWLCGGVYTGNHFDENNPWGCPGMQNLHDEDEYRRINRWRKFGVCCKKMSSLCQKLKLLKYIFWAFGFLLFMIIAPFFLLPWLYSAYHEPTQKMDYARLIVIGILGIPLVPISIILIIAPGSCLMYREYRKRK